MTQQEKDLSQKSLSEEEEMLSQKASKDSVFTLTKDKISDQIQERLALPSKEAKELLEVLLEEIKVDLELGKEVKISGFGKWSVKKKRSRPGRNPHTGGKIQIAARRVVTFHPSDKLRNLINVEVSS